MFIQFKEKFELPVTEVYPYFHTPEDWGRLYGRVKPVKHLRDGWQEVALPLFPFPLVTKMVVDQPNERVRWIFTGFWRGIGEVSFFEQGDATVVEGFEYIVPHGVWLLSKPLEMLVMKKVFERIWQSGWDNLRERQRRH